MEGIKLGIYIVFLLLLSFLSCINWLYFRELKKAKQHLGLYPSPLIKKLIKANFYLIFISGICIALFLFLDRN